MPGAACEAALPGYRTDRHGGIGRRGLGARVPGHDARIGDGGTGDKTRIQRRTEAQRGGGARGEVAIGGGVVAGHHAHAVVTHARGTAVDAGRTGDVTQARSVGREVIRQNHVDGGYRAGIRRRDHVFQRAAGERDRPADHADLLGDAEELGIADHDRRRLVAVDGIAVGIRRFIRQLVAGDRALVGDHGAGCRGAVHRHAEGHDRRLSRTQRTRTRPG